MNKNKMNKILVFGDLILDHYIYGECSRISSEAPVQIVDIEKEEFVLGGAGNVANNLVAFGNDVDIISVIGDCENAHNLQSKLQKIGISIDYLLQEKNRLTSKKTRIIASKQQVLRFDKETTKDISSNSEEKVLMIYSKIIDNYKVVIFSDYGKGFFTENLTKSLIKIANSKNIKVLIDPKGNDYTRYSGAYLLTPNKIEAENATKMRINKGNLQEAIVKLKNDYSLTKSIITLSENGIAVFDDKFRTHPTQAKDIFDVTGAGDTVIAAIATKLACDENIDEAVKFANLAAGIVVAKIGSATATLEEIYHKHSKIVEFNKITYICQNLKKQNKKIVFTNGCFDILHLGHIKYLEEAKKLGDILIIGVNTDDSVRRLKGISRPINPEFDRSYLLSALETVDFIVLFDDDTPLDLIKNVRPEVLVKGADYKGKTVVGSEIAEQTKLIELIDGKSTTKIIKKIQ